MGDAIFDAAYAEGMELSLAEAAAVALAVEHPDLAAGSIRFSVIEPPAPRARPALDSQHQTTERGERREPR